MKNAKLQKIREAVEAWAEENYAKSFGASVIVECWDDSEYEEIFQGVETVSEGMKLAKTLAEIWDEQNAGANAEF